MAQEAEIKTRVTLAGDKEYKAALKGINSELAMAKSAMDAATSAYDRNDKSVAALSTRSRELAKVLQAQQEKVALISEKLTAMQESGSASAEDINKLQLALNKATADMNKTQLALNNVNAELEDSESAAAEAADGIGDVAEAAGELADTDAGNAVSDALGGIAQFAADAGISVEGLVGALGGIAASGAGVALDVIAGAAVMLKDAAVEAGHALVDMAAGVAGYADDINTMSVVTGVSAETLQKWTYASDLVDVSVDTITGSMRKLTSAAGSAAGGSKTAQEKFSALGISVKDSNGQLKDSETLFLECVDALGKVKNETQRDALAMNLLGRSAQELNPLIAAGTDTLRALGEEAVATGYVMDGEALTAANAYQDALDRMSLASTGLKNQIGLAAAGAFEPFVMEITTGMYRITEVLNGGGGFADAIEAGFEELDRMMPMITNAVTTMVTGLSKAIPKVLPNIMKSITDIAKQISDTLPSLFENAIKTLPDMILTITDSFPSIAENLGDALGSGMHMFIASLPKLVGNLSTALGSLFQGAIRGVGGMTKGIFEGIGDLLSTNIDSEILTNDEVAAKVLSGYDPQRIEEIVANVQITPDVDIEDPDVKMNSIYDSIQDYLTDGLADTEEGVEELKTQVETYYQGQIDKVNAWRTAAIANLDTSLPADEYESQMKEINTTADQTIASLQGLSAETQTWIDENAGKSTATVQANLGGLESIKTRAEELNGEIAAMCGSSEEMLQNATQNRAEVVASGASSDISVNLGALAFEKQSYEEQAGQLETDYNAAVADLFAKGLKGADYETAKAAIDAEFETAKETLKQTYDDNMAALWEGIVSATGADTAMESEVSGQSLGDSFTEAFMANMTANGNNSFDVAQFATDFIDSNGLTEEDFMAALGDDFKGWDFSAVMTALQSELSAADWAGGEEGTSMMEGVLEGMFAISEQDVANALPEGFTDTVAGALEMGILSGSNEGGTLTMDELMGLVMGTSFGNAEDSTYVKDAKDAGQAVPDAMATAVEEGAKDVATAGQTVTDSMAGALTGGTGEVRDAATGVADAATDGMDGLEDDAKDIGGYASKGLAAGIAANESTALTAARRLAAKVALELKKGLKVESPSKVTMEIGRYFDLGFVKGVEDNAYKVVQAVSDLGNGGVKALSPTPMAAPVAVAGAAGTTVNVQYSGAFTENQASAFGAYLARSMNDDAMAMGG